MHFVQFQRAKSRHMVSLGPIAKIYFLVKVKVFSARDSEKITLPLPLPKTLPKNALSTCQTR